MAHKIRLQQQKIIDFLADEDIDYPITVIADKIGMNYYVCLARLESLLEEGRVEKVKNGMSYTWRIKK